MFYTVLKLYLILVINNTGWQLDALAKTTWVGKKIIYTGLK